MDVQAYIQSGILELYVSGTLSAQENLEVAQLAKEYPAIQEEIEAIEKAMVALSAAAAPSTSDKGFEQVIDQLERSESTNTRKTLPLWRNYIGWAAAVIFAVGMAWLYDQNNTLSSELENSGIEMEQLRQELLDAKSQITDTEAFLEKLRDQDVTVIAMGGQTVAPEAYSKVYWNAKSEKLLVDANGLPEPPSGYTYQVWSLTLNPLTPTSIGLLADFDSNGERLFELPNPNASEAFGITLEPEGGSAVPTLTQLYTLGQVQP
ncbi:MAG: anti-sigma factor [Flavobacteriaceae bacterium]|nr:anti-sigma factor [Flavobacteriaceae bacterium]